MGIIFLSSNLFTRSWIYGEFGCKFSLTIDVLCTVVSRMFERGFLERDYSRFFF